MIFREKVPHIIFTINIHIISVFYLHERIVFTGDECCILDIKKNHNKDKSIIKTINRSKYSAIRVWVKKPLSMI